MKSYTTLRNLYGTLTNDTSSANLTLGDQMINDDIRYLVNNFYLDERTATATTTASTASYILPYNYARMVDVTITVGTTRYLLQEAPNRQFWDKLNYVAYTSDVPAYYFVFDGYMYVYPTPASSSNTITYTYKIRIPDLTEADYTTGTVAVTNGSTTVTGTGTTFTAAMVGRWIRVTAPTGDGEWYEIGGYTSSTVLTLLNSYAGTTASGASYIIGQMPILEEQYQDLPVYRACEIYFTTRVPDPNRAAMFKRMRDEGYQMLSADVGNKTTDVRISNKPIGLVNPNLFLRY